MKTSERLNKLGCRLMQIMQNAVKELKTANADQKLAVQTMKRGHSAILQLEFQEERLEKMGDEFYMKIKYGKE